MNESKELLEATIKGLQEKIDQVTKDLQMKQAELADVSKPEMTGEMFDNITELIEEGIGYFDFSDADNYDIEFGIDYDGRVEACGLEFNSASELTEKIMNKVDSHYKISTSEDIK
tara:strand:+ start:741 stop:1085 length:345 start_codon:yes stop_codon:yes gene_type:complete